MLSKYTAWIIILVSMIVLSSARTLEAFDDEPNLRTQAQVVWPERAKGNYDIYYSRLTDSGWSGKVPLCESPETDIMPAINVGNDGVIWVVWRADSGQKSELFWLNSDGDGWSHPMKIETGLRFNSAPSMIVDSAGRPWIAWSGSNGGTSDIYFSRWTGNDWEPASRINQADDSPDILPLIGADRDGSLWVCWFGFDGDQYIPHSCKWTGEEWSGEIKSKEDNLYKELMDMDARKAVPMLPDFISDPEKAEKASVYVPGRGPLNSIPMRYLGLGSLIRQPAPADRELMTPGESSGFLVILCFGDSITQGYPYVTAPGGGMRIGGYEPFLEPLLNSDGRPAVAFNWGKGGENTSAGITRIRDVLGLYSGVGFILIMEGTNDYWFISPQDTKYNLDIMINKSREANVIPIIATLTPDTLNPEKQINENYNPLIRDLAAQREVILADQYAACIGNWPNLTGDGLHPNQPPDGQGYPVVAQTWFNAIPEKPIVTTGEPTSIGFTTARLNGTVNPNGTSTTYYFEYGTTTSYGSSTPVTSAGSGTTALTVSASVTGLSNETPYHYRLTATNQGGTAFGADRTFTTLKASCAGCYGDVVVLDDVTYDGDTDCECIAGTSITIGPKVIIESGAHVTFTAPQVIIKSGFHAESGSVVDITTAP